MKEHSNLTVERVRKLVRYNPDTGYFYHRAAGNGRRIMGEAGHVKTNGYRVLRLDGELHYAHQVAWLVTYGEWPSDDIDHRNGIADDNRISNLRVLAQAGNNQNLHAATAKSSSGYLGVIAARGKWRARLQVDGERFEQGPFDTPEKASRAYLEMKREHHPHWHDAA